MAILVAMPMLRTARRPEVSAIERSLAQLSAIKDVGKVTESGHVVAFTLDDIAINAIVVAKGIPWQELEGPCHTCRIWPEAADEVRAHNAHAIVTASHDTAEVKQLAWYLTKAIEALLPTMDSIGVYWGAGNTVSSAKAFLALSRESSPDFLPLYLWLDFRCYGEPDGRVSFFTTGMKSLGLMEIEIKDSERGPAELLDLVYNLAHYLLDNGPVIKDGQTFGLTADQRIPLRLAESFVDRDDTVYRLET